MIKVVCVGDNNVDIYNNMNLVYPGGNSVNVAAYAKLNGADSAYIGVVGNDRFGSLQLNSLKALGVDVSRCRVRDGLTSKSSVNIINGDRIFQEYDNSIHIANPIILDNDDICFIKTYDLIHSSIYTIFDDSALKLLSNTGKPLSFDFSVEWDDEYLKAKCKFVNFAFLSCSHISEKETKEYLRKACEYGAALAVGTRGLEGSILYNGKSYFHQNAYRTEVVDTLGAGDSFITRFLLSYMEGQKFKNECIARFQGKKYTCEDVEDYEDKLIELSLAQGAMFAAKTCQFEGAFGFGASYLE
jgi:fructoselysine 6-kinase